MAKDRVFVIPRNDLEGVAIQGLLERAGVRFLTTMQPWGASWKGLEDAIQEELRGLTGRAEIVGVELAGENPYGAMDVDHHWYEGDDRWRAESSLEQLGTLLGISLTREEKLIAANDRGHIPAMEALGATREEVARVRRMDRAAQGLTEDDENRAAAETEDAEFRGKKAWVNVKGRPTSAHGDRLYGRAREWMVAGELEWAYSGPRHREFGERVFGERHWRGGGADSGYAGVTEPCAQSRAALREWFWEESPAK